MPGLDPKGSRMIAGLWTWWAQPFVEDTGLLPIAISLTTAGMLQNSIVTQSMVTPESMSVFLSIIFIIRQVVWMARWSFSTFTACRKRRHRVQLCSSLLLWMPQESKFVKRLVHQFLWSYYISVRDSPCQSIAHLQYIVPICLYSVMVQTYLLTEKMWVWEYINFLDQLFLVVNCLFRKKKSLFTLH